jgi:hypothetical protein
MCRTRCERSEKLVISVWCVLQVAESVLDQYDWVFYLDADAWITNPEIPLEAVLPAPGGADFVVTDDAAGANAGSWIVRSSDWSRDFLARWWSLDSFIRVCFKVLKSFGCYEALAGCC